jgi:hypothetical protein
MANCDYCGIAIYWVRKDGHSIPMESVMGKQHICTKKPTLREPQTKHCNKCTGEIYFKQTAEGNWIVMDYETDEPHKCTGEARDKHRAWDEDQDYWRRGSKY